MEGGREYVPKICQFSLQVTTNLDAKIFLCRIEIRLGRCGSRRRRDSDGSNAPPLPPHSVCASLVGPRYNPGPGVGPVLGLAGTAAFA